MTLMVPIVGLNFGRKLSSCGTYIDYLVILPENIVVQDDVAGVAA